MAEIASMYGRVVSDYHGVDSGYRNTSHFFTASDGEELNFILYKHEPGIVGLIERTNALGQYLATGGLPVRKPVDPRIIQVGHRYGSLYGYLGGQTIPWKAYTMKHIKLLGYGLARFHEVAVEYPGNLPDIETVYREIYMRMERYFDESDVKRAMKQKLALAIELPDYRNLLDYAYSMSDRTPLHMDFVRSNLLFDDANASSELAVETLALSGILDLEKAAFGHPLFDLARTYAFLLVDCDKPAEKIYKYFLRSGYVKRGGGDGRMFLDASTAPLFERLVTLFLVYDFYKFLRQNPYESLEKNHHFNRTISLLEALGKITRHDGV